MTTADEGGSGWRRGRQWAGLGLLLGSLAAGVSCASFPGPVPDARLLVGDGSRAQEGELTLHDGQEAAIRYDRAFRAPPRLVIVEFRNSWSQDRPYSKADFQFSRQDAAGFAVVNNHFEPGRRTVATVKWRAEGVPAAEQPPAPPPSARPTQVQVADAVKALGGTVTFDVVSPTHPIVAVDLHNTRATDAHLEPLRGLPALRSLNLSGTRVTDAGLRVVGDMTTLQALFVNQTAVGDTGLASLKGLTELRQLGLYHTRVTDDGLAHLGGLANLRELALSGPRVTDRGLAQLKSLRNLRQLTLSQTGTTPAGTQELKKALPKTDVIQ